MINEILEKKYQILAAGIKGSKTRDAKEAFLKYKDEEISEIEGRRACTETELHGTLKGNDRARLKLAIPILRHFKRVDTKRVKKETYLIVHPH